jgi:predicted MFS family arabinose efflux permease
MLYVLYTLDNLLYLSTTCLTTYVQKIAAPEDLMPTLSMGVSFNHIASVLVPLVGAALWNSFGYGATFYGGAALVGASALLAMRMPVHKPKLIQEAA